jgi:transcription termination factor Rho
LSETTNAPVEAADAAPSGSGTAAPARRPRAAGKGLSGMLLPELQAVATGMGIPRCGEDAQGRPRRRDSVVPGAVVPGRRHQRRRRRREEHGAFAFARRGQHPGPDRARGAGQCRSAADVDERRRPSRGRVSGGQPASSATTTAASDPESAATDGDGAGRRTAGNGVATDSAVDAPAGGRDRERTRRDRGRRDRGADGGDGQQTADGQRVDGQRADGARVDAQAAGTPDGGGTQPAAAATGTADGAVDGQGGQQRERYSNNRDGRDGRDRGRQGGQGQGGQNQGGQGQGGQNQGGQGGQNRAGQNQGGQGGPDDEFGRGGRRGGSASAAATASAAGGKAPATTSRPTRSSATTTCSCPIAGHPRHPRQLRLRPDHGYLPGPNDVYVSLAQVRRYGPAQGDVVTGAVRQPTRAAAPRQVQRAGPARHRQRHGPEAHKRPDFTKLTPLYPQDRLRLETEPGSSPPASSTW